MGRTEAGEVLVRKLDETRGMTPEQHALLDMSERIFKHEDRLGEIERVMKLLARELERMAKDHG